MSFFEGRVNAGSIQAFNASCAALLRVKHEGRVFGITFGHGRHLLKDGVVEQAFGLRVVLNAIDPQRIRTLDKDSLDVVGRRTREQVSKEDSIASFGLNVDQDLVRAVTGSTTDEELGKRLTGADALFLSVPNSFSSLALLLSKCLRLYRSTAYRTSFEWIDHIAPERDPAIVSPLEQRLLGHIRNKRVDKIWLAVPDVLDWSKVDGFRYAGWYDRDLSTTSTCRTSSTGIRTLATSP